MSLADTEMEQCGVVTKNNRRSIAVTKKLSKVDGKYLKLPGPIKY